DVGRLSRPKWTAERKNGARSTSTPSSSKLGGWSSSSEPKREPERPRWRRRQSGGRGGGGRGRTLRGIKEGRVTSLPRLPVPLQPSPTSTSFPSRDTSSSQS